MIDDVPLANDTSAENYPRGLELSLDYIEKIEIVRGPNSALWGADAFSGVINIITRRGKDLQGTILSGKGGSFSTAGGNIAAGYQVRDVDFFLFGSFVESKGFEPSHSGNNRPADSFSEFYGKVTVNEHLTVSGRYSNYSNYFTINFLDRHEGLEYSPFSFIQASYNDRFWDKVNATIKVYTHYFHNYQKENWWFGIPEFNLLFPVETRFSQKDWRYGLESKFDWNWQEKHLLTFGFSWALDEASSTHNAFNGLDLLLFPHFQNYRLGFYVQDKYKVSDHIEITGGFRYDKHENYRRKISPRFSLSWFPEDCLDIKLFYGQAFRTPDLLALTRDINVTPEKIESIETQLTYRPLRGTVIQANYFYNILDDLLENVTQGVGSQKRSEVEQGTEITVKWYPLADLCLYSNYTFLFGERQSNGPRRVTIVFPIPGIPGGELSLDKIYHLAPDHVLNLGGSLTWKKYTLNVEVHYSDSRDVGAEFYGITKNNLAPYWNTDLNLLAEGIWRDQLDIHLKVRNLFNRHFMYRGENELFSGEERSIFAEVYWRF
jgi:outer membrane receptor for ferrienterochelin and colicin